MSEPKKMKEQREFLQMDGWQPFEWWPPKICFLTKNGVIKALTSTGTFRDLKRSEKEQMK